MAIRAIAYIPAPILENGRASEFLRTTPGAGVIFSVEDGLGEHLLANLFFAAHGDQEDGLVLMNEENEMEYRTDILEGFENGEWTAYAAGKAISDLDTMVVFRRSMNMTDIFWRVHRF